MSRRTQPVLEDTHMNQINKQKKLTRTRVERSVQEIQKIHPDFYGFSLANVPKVNSKAHTTQLVECWIFTGVAKLEKEKQCKDYINNHKWHEMLQWLFMYIMDSARLHLLNLPGKNYNDQNVVPLLRAICLKFDEKFSIAHQAPPVPLFPIQKMFAYSPTKGDPSTSAAGKLLGSPSARWENLQAVYDDLVSDVSREAKKASLTTFIQLFNIAPTAKNRVKLKSIDSAYEYGYKYPKWMLQKAGGIDGVDEVTIKNETKKKSKNKNNKRDHDLSMAGNRNRNSNRHNSSSRSSNNNYSHNGGNGSNNNGNVYKNDDNGSVGSSGCFESYSTFGTGLNGFGGCDESVSSNGSSPQPSLLSKTHSMAGTINSLAPLNLMPSVRNENVSNLDMDYVFDGSGGMKIEKRANEDVPPRVGGGDKYSFRLPPKLNLPQNILRIAETNQYNNGSGNGNGNGNGSNGNNGSNANMNGSFGFNANQFDYSGMSMNIGICNDSQQQQQQPEQQEQMGNFCNFSNMNNVNNMNNINNENMNNFNLGEINMNSVPNCQVFEAHQELQQLELQFAEIYQRQQQLEREELERERQRELQRQRELELERQRELQRQLEEQEEQRRMEAHLEQLKELERIQEQQMRFSQSRQMQETFSVWDDIDSQVNVKSQQELPLIPIMPLLSTGELTNGMNTTNVMNGRHDGDIHNEGNGVNGGFSNISLEEAMNSMPNFDCANNINSGMNNLNDLNSVNNMNNVNSSSYMNNMNNSNCNANSNNHVFEPNNNISEQVIGQAFGGGDEMIGVANDNTQFESQFGNMPIGNFENFENFENVGPHIQDVQLLRAQMEARFHAEWEAKARMQAEAELQAARANEIATRVAASQHGNTFGVSAFPIQTPAMQQQQSSGFTNFDSQLW